MHSFGAAQPQTTSTLHAVDDEDLAGRSTMRLLISASTASEVQAIASRVHVAGLRGGFPFREIRARDLGI